MAVAAPHLHVVYREWLLDFVLQIDLDAGARDREIDDGGGALVDGEVQLLPSASALLLLLLLLSRVSSLLLLLLISGCC